MPHDFQEWYATMSSQFESRFGRLFRGPMWSGCERDNIKNPLVVGKDTLYCLYREIEKSIKGEEKNLYFDVTVSLACYNFHYIYYRLQLKVISSVIVFSETYN